MFRLFALTAILIAIGAYFLSTRENLTADVVNFWRQPMVQVAPDSTLPPRPDLEPDEATAVPGQRRLRTLPAESNPDVDIPDLLDGEAQMERLGPIIVNTDGTLSRIDNWKGMNRREKEMTIKRLRKRNAERLARLKDERGITDPLGDDIPIDI